ncbi:MAG TPA: hypothetical protein EYO02_08235 [Rhodospirillales bacterium]|nr:hypothetical protein [Rhodospirillales bacterium]
MLTSDSTGSDTYPSYIGAKYCQVVLFVLSLVFLYLTISCYSYYMGTDYNEEKNQNLIYAGMQRFGDAGRSSLPNMPAGFAIASAICMLGVAIIEATKFVDSTNKD